MFYRDLKRRRKLVENFIRKNPTTTHKEIKKELHTKIDKVYSGGIAEAFKRAGVKFPRTFKFKTKEENKKILLDYIKNNPQAGGHKIKKIQR